MSSILLGVSIGAVTSISFERDGSINRRVWFWKGIFFCLISCMCTYFRKPSLSAFLLGESLWWLVAFLTLVNFAFHNKDDYRGYRIPLFAGAGSFALTILFTVSGWSLFRAQTKADLIGTVTKKEWTESMAPIDPRHIRLVSSEQAAFIGGMGLGDGLGSVFKPGEYSLQKVGDHFYYVAPLDFLGFRSWESQGVCPGYLMVDAQDPKLSATLVKTNIDGSSIALRYTPEACFGYDLERHIRSSGYATYDLEGYHLELDDEHKPHWVVTLLRPSTGFSGDKIEGVLIVDPTTGSMVRHSLTDVPAWVDRVVPKETATNYLSWWGEFRFGFWDAFWQKPGLVEPTSDGLAADRVLLVYGNQGKCFWYSGLTSLSDTDETLLGFVLMDSRTGQTTEYKVSSNAGTAKKALGVANNRVSEFKSYHGTDPIPYNVYGHLAYIVPVVGTGHIFERVVIVDVTCQHSGVGTDTASALLDFKRELASANLNSAAPTSIAAKKSVRLHVDRVRVIANDRSTMVMLWCKELPGLAFYGTKDLGSALLLTEAGDEVSFTYLDTDESTVPIADFRNMTVRVPK